MSEFSLGLIEGFYGRQWRWDQRNVLPAQLARWGYKSYIYAPKGDASLRSRWRDDFTEAHFSRLRQLSDTASQAGIAWGLGLSPAGLQAKFGPDDRRDLSRKIAQIAALQPASLWILFDDLPAGVPQLAARQLEVIDAVRQQLPDLPVAMCPSYYSEDPILEELFGACPAEYFSTLNAGLASDVDLLWTGPKVISSSYSAADMRRAAAILGRKPLLWDNYPVNDGRKSSRFLNVLPFSGRPAGLAQWCRGHFVNPMNQFHLSLLPLMGLAKVYTESSLSRDVLFAQALATLPRELAELLKEHAQIFQCDGLDGMAEADKQRLAREAANIDHPAAAELAAWLREEYRFDPDCLTE
ncbi:beta-N-acetylglucosaminidase domain-containing protein [Spongiibacter sp.]|uniref:beta-N-acetylglucosaminidase domain-containing protein n=1 Tax=Spongiibacter sp. TaxID=2024860 RepID=UPI003563825B